MTLLRRGVRTTLNLGLGAVLLLGTLTFAGGYALLERRNVLEAERDHLRHMATILRRPLSSARDRAELESMVTEFNRRLSAATQRAHHLVVEDQRGVALATSRFGALDSPADISIAENDSTPPGSIVPAAIGVVYPLSANAYRAEGDGRRPARLVLHESTERIGAMFRASLALHLAFAAALVALCMLATAVLVHRVVVRPVQELVAATEGIARDGAWEPVLPHQQREDEIGILASRLSEMSQRLRHAVRAERYESAHLVAVRVRRALQDPLRKAAMQLAILEELLPPGSDEARVQGEIVKHWVEIEEIVRELNDLDHGPSDPKSV